MLIGYQFKSANIGSAIASPSIPASAVLPVSKGGTGVATLSAYRNALGLGDTNGAKNDQGKAILQPAFGGTGNALGIPNVPVNDTVQIYGTETPNNLGYVGIFAFVDASKIIPTYTNTLTNDNSGSVNYDKFQFINGKYEIQGDEAGITLTVKCVKENIQNYKWANNEGPNDGWFYLTNVMFPAATTVGGPVTRLSDGKEFTPGVQIYQRRLIIKSDLANKNYSNDGTPKFLYYGDSYSFNIKTTGFVDSYYDTTTTNAPAKGYVSTWRRIS